MADTCVSTPTQTRTDVSTSHNQVTTFSVSTSTAPASIETIVLRTCSADAPAPVVDKRDPAPTSSCIPTVTTSYITHPGNTSVVTVPVVVSADYTITNLVTLWGTSCSHIYTPPPDPITSTSTSTYTPSPDPITTSTYTPPTNTITSYSIYTPPTTIVTSYSTYTPPTSTITSSSILISNGSTSVSYFTSTSTSAPTLVAVSQTPASDKKANNVGPIVGSVVGGLVALLLIGFITWKLINKHDETFNNDRNDNKISKDSDPRPYHYNRVGQQATNPTTMSPQMNAQGLDGMNSQGVDGMNAQGLDGMNAQGVDGMNAQGLGGQGFNNIGPQPSQPPLHHVRNPSLTPLLAAVGVAAVGAGAGSISTTSRRSTSDPQPVGPLVTQAGQGQGQGYAPSSYPSVIQNLGRNQTYGAVNTQAQGLASGSGQTAGSVPTSSLAPNTSVGSTGPHMPPIIPIVAGTVRNNRQQQYEDPFNRTSSPASTREQRILQVTNADPSSSSYNRGSIYDPNAYYAEGSSSSSGVYDPNEYYAQGFASSSAGAGPSSLAGPSGGAASSGGSAFTMDGKGRPLGPKVPLVHLDGGLYQQPVPGVQTGPAPPAYME